MVRSRYSKQWRFSDHRINKISLKTIFFERAQTVGLKHSTARKYWGWIRCLILTNKPLIHPDQFSDTAIIAFVNKLKTKHLSQSTVNQAIDALRFLYWEVLTKRRKLQSELQTLRRKIPSEKNSSIWKQLIYILFKR